MIIFLIGIIIISLFIFFLWVFYCQGYDLGWRHGFRRTDKRIKD